MTRAKRPENLGPMPWSCKGLLRAARRHGRAEEACPRQCSRWLRVVSAYLCGSSPVDNGNTSRKRSTMMDLSRDVQASGAHRCSEGLSQAAQPAGTGLDRRADRAAPAVTVLAGFPGRGHERRRPPRAVTARHVAVRTRPEVRLGPRSRAAARRASRPPASLPRMARRAC